MSSVANSQTILDCISWWISVFCREPGCTSLRVDAIWLRGDDASPEDVEFCPDHALARTPRSEQASTRAALVRTRQMGAWMGLTHSMAQRALHVGEGSPPLLPPTLFGYRRGTGNGCNIDVFDIRGYSDLSVRDFPNHPSGINLPIYRAHHFPPDMLSGDTPMWRSHVRVELGFTVSLPTRPQAPIVVSWQPHAPSEDYREMDLERNDLTGKEKRQLDDALSLFSRGKRNPGRYRDDEDIVCEGFKRDLDRVIPKLRDSIWEEEHDLGRHLGEHELAKELNFSVRTLQNRFKRCKIEWKQTRRRMY